MNAQGSALTDQGRVRSTNEDFFVEDVELGLFVVCDGVSGQRGGEVASRMCAQAIQDFVRENRGVIDRYRQDANPQTRTQLLHLMQKAIQLANAKIHAEAEGKPELQGMATTVEALLAVGDSAVLGHVGDSRCYLSRGDKAHCLTQDHKVGAEMVKQGTWTREEAAKSGYSNVLTRAIGQERFVQPDMLQLELMAGDLFVLCTDGLHDYFEGASPKVLRDLTAQGAPAAEPAALAQSLVKYALESGGKDNVTVSVVRIAGATKAATVAAQPGAPATSGKGAAALDIMKRSEVVGKVPLFRYMSYPELMKILNLVSVREYRPGETLIQEGTAGTEMFILVSGIVEVVKNGQALARMQKGDFFGEMCFFDDAPRSASIRAADPVVALALSKQDFLPLLRKEGQIAVKFLWAVNQEINQRLRAANLELATVKATLSSGNVPFQLPESPQ